LIEAAQAQTIPAPRQPAGSSGASDGARGPQNENHAPGRHLAIDAEVDLCTAEGAYSLQARLNVSLPGLERDVAQAVVDAGTRPVRTPKPYAATSTS